MHISKNLDQKHTSQDSNQSSDVGCRYPRRQLSQYITASPHRRDKVFAQCQFIWENGVGSITKNTTGTHIQHPLGQPFKSNRYFFYFDFVFFPVLLSVSFISLMKFKNL